MKPKISIIMGIYNPKNKEMIDKCLDSIMNQTFKEWECILCNDGTTNGLFDYIKKIMGMIPVLFLLKMKKIQDLGWH